MPRTKADENPDIPGRLSAAERSREIACGYVKPSFHPGDDDSPVKAKFASEGEARLKIASDECSAGRTREFPRLKNQGSILFGIPSIVGYLIFQDAERLWTNVFRLLFKELRQVLRST